MASADQVVEVIRDESPAANHAPFGVRAGGSTPAENSGHWSFDAAAIEYTDFLCRLVGYGGGGLTFTLPWRAATAVADETRWGIAIRRLDTAEDIDAAHAYDFNDVDATAPGTSGQTAYPTVTFTHGADMDNWANGELAIIRVRRNATHANDDMTGDAQLLDIRGIET